MAFLTVSQADPKAGYLALKPEIDAAIARVLDSGWFILGKEVEAFEREFAAFIGPDQRGVGVANGTDALVLALRALGVGPGDGVVTVSHTAVATVSAIEQTGAVPVLVDVDEAYGMDPAALEAVLDAQPVPVKAAIPVHLYGQAADLETILRVCERRGVAVLEDCSQAHGAEWRGRRLGTYGRVAAFSLYPTKNLGALGDGGIVTTADPEVEARVRALREYGWRERYVSDIKGQNSRLDEIQAAVLRVKLAHLDRETARRQAIAAAYDEGLRGLGLELPRRRPGSTHVFHQYVVASPARDALRAALKERGVMSNVHYPVPVHLQPAYRGITALGPGGLPRTEAMAGRILSLPMFGQLDDAQVAHVIRSVREASALAKAA